MNGRSFLNQATMLLGVVAFVAFSTNGVIRLNGVRIQ